MIKLINHQSNGQVLIINIISTYKDIIYSYRVILHNFAFIVCNSLFMYYIQKINYVKKTLFVSFMTHFIRIKINIKMLFT